MLKLYVVHARLRSCLSNIRRAPARHPRSRKNAAAHSGADRRDVTVAFAPDMKARRNERRIKRASAAQPLKPRRDSLIHQQRS
ncbi:hypothetical protein FM111_11085 [Brevundimonas diminuta 3F5N]|uniref:Uncharacterized protein n=1 Tax=Brevundimonas diminuta 3F5N TaxID=1255603 RepID=A0A1R4GAC0_BREDI|nr:hypothetical protein FM111_11085 [Brevundimonas diminuta 3F5N]